jgi:hypothetical protein
VGTSGSKGLEWLDNFNGHNSGYIAGDFNYIGFSGNTNASLYAYQVSFDMAILSGVGLNNIQMDIQGWSRAFSGVFSETGTNSIDTSSVAVGSGFQHISVNLGVWAANSGFNPQSSSLSIVLVLNGSELVGGGPVSSEDIVLDNLQISLVPEPSTFALVGVGLAGLGCLRRRFKK